MKNLVPVIATTSIVLSSCVPNTPEGGGTRAVRVPMELVNRTPVLNVRINEIDTRLQLDIGSGTTLTLFPEILSELDTVLTGEVIESIGMEGVVMQNPVHLVSSVQLGGVFYKDIEVRQDGHTAQHRVETIAGRGTYGRVGRGLFEDGKLVIDYRNESLTVIPPGAPDHEQAVCRGLELPLASEKNNLGLVTRVQTDIGEIYSVWDTGARGNIMVKHTTDAAGLELQARDRFETRKFVINGHDFGPVRMNVWDVPLPHDLHALLGYWFFSDKLVCVDFPGERIFVQPNDES